MAYAKTPARRRRQILGDLLMVGWVAGWAWLAYSVWSALMATAEPARRIVASTGGMREDFRSAGDSAAKIPLAGEELRKPFDLAGGSLERLGLAAEDQVRSLEQLATLCGVLLFVVPVALALLLWVPARVRFIREALATARLLDDPADVELLALRALAGQPLADLARISPDPLADWRARDWPVVVALADLELQAGGLRVPADLRDHDPTVP
ncbi:MAG: hypothetical protein Q4G46_14245, partial [Propionibacteriaceae bacterium]|nr:hypothetical protein [Propionibacteriaceae bacterium]